MTMAPDILAALPKLPEDLEYRFVSKHMLLLDVHANLIVDYVLNAIPVTLGGDSVRRAIATTILALTCIVPASVQERCGCRTRTARSSSS